MAVRSDFAQQDVRLGALGLSRFQYFLEATTQFRDLPLQSGHTAHNAFVGGRTDAVPPAA